MDWGDVERLIGLERERGNPVAEIIVGCKFSEGKIVLGLREEVWDEEGSDGDETDEEEGEAEGGQVVRIEVDLGLSVWANAREYFDKKKVAAEKVRFLIAFAAPILFDGFLLVGIANSAVFVKSFEECGTQDNRGPQEKPKGRKTFNEKYAGNKMVRKVFLVHQFRRISDPWVYFSPLMFPFGVIVIFSIPLLTCVVLEMHCKPNFLFANISAREMSTYILISNTRALPSSKIRLKTGPFLQGL